MNKPTVVIKTKPRTQIKVKNTVSVHADNYEALENLPSINGVDVVGALTGDDLKLVNKITSIGANKRVYHINPDGTQGVTDVEGIANPFTIVQRRAGGRVEVGAPVNASDATTKTYVDGKIAVIAGILENTIVNVTTVEDAYNTRVTAGGLSVVDEAPTTVHKITGASAASINLAKLANGTFTSNGVTFVSSSETGAVHISGSLDEGATFASLTVSHFSLRQGTYTLYAPHKVDKVSWIVRNEQNEKVESLSWNGTDTVKSFTVSADGSYNLYIYINESLSTVLDYTETPMLLRGDRTASLPAFAPYYAGIKSAGFKGLLSTGRNLLRPSADTNVTRNGLTYTADASTGVVTISGTKTSGSSVSSLLGSFDLPKGTYTLYLPHKIQGIGWAVKTMAHAQVGSLSWNTDTKFSSFTVETAGRFYLLAYAIGDGLTVNYTDTPMILPGIVTENFPPFETYHADTTFTLTEAVTVGRWDSLDVDDQKKTTGTALMTFDGTEDWNTEVTQSGDYRLQLQVTGFTVPASANDEPDLVCNLYPPKNANSTYTGMTGISLQDTRLQIYDPSYNAADSVADWKTHLADLAAKGNPLTVAYHRATPTETPFSLPKTYQAWHGGMEIIDGDPSGLPLTVTQDYYVKAGGESA